MAGAPPPFMFPELRDALLDVAGDGGAVNSKRLGQWLRKNLGAIADGLRIEEGKFQRGYQFWKVVKVESADKSGGFGGFWWESYTRAKELSVTVTSGD